MLGNMKIRTYLVIVAVAPALVALVLGGWILNMERARYVQLEQSEVLLGLAFRLDTALAEIDAERSLAVDAVNGREVAPEALSARSTALDTLLAELPLAEFPTDARSAVDGLRTRLAEREALHQTILGGTLTPLEVLDLYSDESAALIDTVSALFARVEEAQLQRQLVGLLSLIEAQEHSLREKLIGAAGLTEGRFSGALMDRFESNVQARRAYLRTFAQYGRPAQVAVLNEFTGSDTQARLDGYREAMLRQGLFGTPEGVTREDWARTLGAKMSRLVELEAGIRSGLMADIAKLQADTASALTATLAALAVTYVIIGALFFAVARQLGQRTGAIIAAVRALSEGDYGAEMPAVNRSEMGQIASALRVFQGELREKVERERAALREDRTRAEAAQRRAELADRLRTSLAQTVEAAVLGEFSGRVTTDLGDEDLVRLAETVNGLMRTVDAGLQDIEGMLEAIASADLTASMTGTQAGAFERLRRSASRTVAELTEVVTVI
ncbi:MAG: nitrate- and nitrite sensing domain-containing protein, partial [Pseudomonadota bacterium]